MNDIFHITELSLAGLMVMFGMCSCIPANVIVTGNVALEGLSVGGVMFTVGMDPCVVSPKAVKAAGVSRSCGGSANNLGLAMAN